MINLLYNCAIADASGYAEASRNYVAAISNYPEEINISVKSTNFERTRTDQAAYAHIINHLLNKSIVPEVQIIHMTPDNFPRHKRGGVKNIGYTTWETSILPKKWIGLCNMLDEIWTTSDWNVEVMKSSGVKKPVKKLPHTIDLNQFENIQHKNLNLPKDKFIFYSIFQWHERKNPVGLIKAFLSEFRKTDDVCLVLKTYLSNVQRSNPKDLENQLQSIVKSMHLKGDHAPIYLIQDNLSRAEMLSLHEQGDCFVLPARSEGFGITFLEAMAAGNPAIGTRYSGNLEFMTDENSYLVDSHLTPVSFMPWELYNGKAMWAEPALGQLMEYMREAYSNPEKASKRALKGKVTVEEYSWKNVGSNIVDLLNE